MADPTPLTDEYIYRIAPDGKSMQAAQELVRDGLFRNARTSDGGTMLEAQCKSYAVRVNLADPDHPETGCDCASYKHPCKHALGLLLLAAHSPEAFAQEGSGKGLDDSPLQGATPRPVVPESASPTNLEEALLQAILAEPADDGPRLIYADWLEENGQSDRAEFIRVQIDLARTPESDLRRKPLLAREKKLWSAHRREWLKDLPAQLGRKPLRFQRGFFEEVSGAAYTWAKYAGKLFAQHPIYRMRLTGTIGPTHAGLLAVVPALARLQALALNDCSFEEPGKTLQILFGTPFLSGLRRLDLDRSGFSTRDVAVLAASPLLGRIRELNLASNPRLGPKGAEMLAESAQVVNLRELSLAGTTIGDAGARALLGSPHLQGLTRLDLRGVALGDGVKAGLRQRFDERVLLDGPIPPANLVE